MSPVPQQRSSTRALGTLQNGIELARSAPPPQPVNVERKHVIQQIVARRNRGEHLADGLRRRLAVARTGGSRAYDPLIYLLIHMMVAGGEPGVPARPPYAWTGETPIAPLQLIPRQLPNFVDR